MAEQLTLNQWVGGSTPPGCTIISPQIHLLKLRTYCFQSEQLESLFISVLFYSYILAQERCVKSVIATMESRREYLL